MLSGDCRLNKTLTSSCSFLWSQRTLSFFLFTFSLSPSPCFFYFLWFLVVCKFILPLLLSFESCPISSLKQALMFSVFTLRLLWCKRNTPSPLLFNKNTAGENKPALHTLDFFGDSGSASCFHYITLNSSDNVMLTQSNKCYQPWRYKLKTKRESRKYITFQYLRLMHSLQISNNNQTLVNATNKQKACVASFWVRWGSLCFFSFSMNLMTCD